MLFVEPYPWVRQCTCAATTLVPGSHKSVFLHPRVHNPETGEGNMRVNGATLEGAIEVHLKAGDAVKAHTFRTSRALALRLRWAQKIAINE